MILILHMSLVFTITYNQIVVRTLLWLHGLTWVLHHCQNFVAPRALLIVWFCVNFGSLFTSPITSALNRVMLCDCYSRCDGVSPSDNKSVQLANSLHAISAANREKRAIENLVRALPAAVFLNYTQQTKISAEIHVLCCACFTWGFVTQRFAHDGALIKSSVCSGKRFNV